MTWPTSKLIRMTEATLNGNTISPAAALRRQGGDYRIIDGPYEGALISPYCPGDTITEWEEQTITPVEDLNTLRIALQGVKLNSLANGALQRIISHTPKSEATPIEKATYALAEKTSRIRGATPHEYLAKLLAKLTSPSKSATYTSHLIDIAAIGTAWLNTVSHNEDTVREIAEKAATLYCRDEPVTLQDVCDSAYEVAISTQDPRRTTLALTDLAARALTLAARNDK